MTSPSPAIADTSILSALCRIGRLEILRLRFPLVIVPRAVHVEIMAAAVPEISQTIDAACAAGWMRISDTLTDEWRPPISRLGPVKPPLWPWRPARLEWYCSWTSAAADELPASSD